MYEALLYVCLSVPPSHLFKQRPFHLKLCAGCFFSLRLFLLFGTRWRGARKHLFCQGAPVKRGCPPQCNQQHRKDPFWAVKEDNWVWTSRGYRNGECISRPCPPLTEALAWRILVFDQWRVEVVVRPHRGQRPPPLPCLPCTWRLLTPSSGRSQGAVGWFGHRGYHDLSRHCSSLPWSCQGDMMNSDLKCSWLETTVFIQGKSFSCNFESCGWRNSAEVRL